jgi:hypothetical protein
MLPCALSAFGAPPGAQTGCQFATQRASTLDEQGLVDSLMADAHVMSSGSRPAGVGRSAQDSRHAPTGDPAAVHVVALSKIRTGQAQEHRSEPRPAPPADPEHRPARPRSAQALPALVDGLIARRAIELSTRDTPNRHYGWRRCAATPARSLTPPVRSDEPPPVRCSLVPAKRNLLAFGKRKISSGMRLRRRPEHCWWHSACLPEPSHSDRLRYVGAGRSIFTRQA